TPPRNPPPPTVTLILRSKPLASAQEALSQRLAVSITFTSSTPPAQQLEHAHSIAESKENREAEREGGFAGKAGQAQ
ncbi:hypothetical protein LTR95_019547, partial [Oleoguttula sp. CCFEE 5521]